MLKPEKSVVYIELLENDKREIRAVKIFYNDGSKETISQDKIQKYHL